MKKEADEREDEQGSYFSVCFQWDSAIPYPAVRGVGGCWLALSFVLSSAMTLLPIQPPIQLTVGAHTTTQTADGAA